MRRDRLLLAGAIALGGLLAYLLIFHGSDTGNGLAGHMGAGPPPKSDSH